MNSDEIRERFLRFFEERGHTRLASASLVPPPSDRTVLLTTAGMQPLKPYFLGLETPPASRLTSCQKCFRTPDIEKVGSTLRHLTFFEMLGNFSIGDYFKQGAIELAWELSREVFGFSQEDIWVTVFAGDDELGLGPDEEAIELWQAVGVPRERIVGCARSENFWEAGPVGPSGPCSELYLDRGLHFGTPEDLPGTDNERFLEFWNLVFMQYDQNPHDHLTPLPARSIDTGLGLNRMAAILQGKDSVFETDQFWPLIELGQELSGQRYGQDQHADRALRILADHARGMSFMVADGVVPSNEDRGYVLRRLMRRAIQQGRRLQMPAGFLVRYANVVRELMGASYGELHQQREAIETWLSSEEDNFGRTLEQGTKLLDDVIARALAGGAQTIAASDAFTLHDTYGFPFELTTELASEHGLSVDEEGFASLMDSQRARARAAASSAGEQHDPREQARLFASQHASKTSFVGYDTQELTTTVDALAQDDGRLLVKLTESPFYPAGGGQIADQGELVCEQEGCLARVKDVFRLGDDQVLEVTLERGSLQPGERILARVDHLSRHATECNHTATHLLHAALRERLGTHVRQAGSYVGLDKLRFDFSHSHALSAQELADVEDQVNERILANEPVSAITTTLEEAKSLGAMALFGEKYGDVVRMVQIGDGSYSRELCGGTHVRTTAEIGLLRITAETSSAANVRRIEALTGPAAVTLVREHDRWLSEIARTLRAKPEDALRVVRERDEQRRALEKSLKSDTKRNGALDVAELAGRALDISGARVLTEAIDAPDAKALLDIADRVKGKLGDAAIVLGAAADGRVHLLVSIAPVLVQRGLNASELVKVAAAVVGGGGGGRDTMAQAGGRYPEKLNDALKAARTAIESALGG
ncbi:MAG TPA: alanine--tRNA ligase [Solirubrobacteraceae bacterium]